MKKIFVVAIVILLQVPTFAQTYLFTGQSTQELQLSQNVTLQYTSDISTRAQTRNEASAAGWCGLGWKFDFPSIFVAHNNTVDMNDDRWFFDDGYGNTSEIVRVFAKKGTVVF